MTVLLRDGPMRHPNASSVAPGRRWRLLSLSCVLLLLIGGACESSAGSGVEDSGEPPEVAQLAASVGATCARSSEGAITCWGTGWRGRRGTGLQLACEGIADCERDTRCCLGDDESPAEGDGPIASLRATALDCTEHACVAAVDDALYFWGFGGPESGWTEGWPLATQTIGDDDKRALGCETVRDGPSDTRG